MSTTTFVLMVLLLAASGAAIGFFGGRMGARDSAPAIADRAQTPTTSAFPVPGTPLPEEAAAADLRSRLLHALELPASDRDRAIRLAMNAWLAVDGAAAIMAARDDPELGDVAHRVTQLALFAYPEIFIDDPSLLEGIPDAQQSIAMVAGAIARIDPDAARAMIDAHLSGSMYRDLLLSSVDQFERAEQDPRAELESIAAGTGMGDQLGRLRQIVNRLAADDPVATAELIDDLPASLRDYATQALVDVWSGKNPEEAAAWLAQRSVQDSRDSLNRLARRWGQEDFEAANAFADTLAGRKRAFFLTGLASAAQHWPKEELLAWVSRYEGEPAYPDLMVSAVQRFAQEDVDAAIDLVETLPERIQLASYRSVVASLAFRHPEAAVELMEEIGNESVRDDLVPMVSRMWARRDAESALEWSRGLSPGRPRDQAIASITSSLVNVDTDFDIDRAVEAVSEIEDPEIRKNAVWQLLFAVDSDDEAIRLGRDHGFNEAHVLAVRGRMRSPGLVSGDILAPASGTVRLRLRGAAADPDADQE